MTRREESCLGCGQMLVAVPAGGGWAHLSLALPVSLSSAVEKATDGVRRFCSGPCAAPPVCPSLASSDARAASQGNMGTEPGPRPSLAAGVNCLQRGVAPPPPRPQTLCCLLVDVSKNYISTLMSWLSEGIFLFRQNMPSQGLSRMAALKLSGLEATCQPAHFSHSLH